NIICNNCKKPGHIKADCLSKGGGKEGQGPCSRGRNKKSEQTNQAEEVNGELLEAAYHATAPGHFIGQDWLLDSGTTSHI
ncbi:hypothetical protein DACRYDRAFT_37182, partial [Dacryopinax primogenitus]